VNVGSDTRDVAGIDVRNREALRRLAYIAEARD
jgi:hypothetical protein